MLLRDVHLLPSTCGYIELQSWRVRESFLTRANVSQARVNRFCAALKRFSQYMPSVRVIDCFIVPEEPNSTSL